MVFMSTNVDLHFCLNYNSIAVISIELCETFQKTFQKTLVKSKNKVMKPKNK